MSDRALVKNAADPEQVKRAARKTRDREARFLEVLRASLSHVEVRAVFADILERAGLYATTFDQSQSVMAFNEGRRNFGLELRAALEQADERLTEVMDQERRARLRAEARENDAAFTKSAAEMSGVDMAHDRDDRTVMS